MILADDIAPLLGTVNYVVLLGLGNPYFLQQLDRRFPHVQKFLVEKSHHLMCQYHQLFADYLMRVECLKWSTCLQTWRRQLPEKFWESAYAVELQMSAHYGWPNEAATIQGLLTLRSQSVMSVASAPQNQLLSLKDVVDVNATHLFRAEDHYAHAVVELLK